MKKIFLAVAAVAMLGLASCANKSASTEVTTDSDSIVEVVDSLTVTPDSIVADTTVVAE